MLYVCSKSTKMYVPKGAKIYLAKGPATTETLEMDKHDTVFAIGGGAVIDTAKILSNKHLVVWPTTAAGAASTSHAVYWDGHIKCSYKGRLPDVVRVTPSFLGDVPQKILEYSYYDALAHCLESLWSKDGTQQSDYYALDALLRLEEVKNFSIEDRFRLVTAGNIAGKAIEIAKTNILHSLSYPMTSMYGIPHGKALGVLIKRIGPQMPFYKYDADIEWMKLDRRSVKKIVREGMKYEKMFNIKQDINEFDLVRMLRQ